MPDAADQEMGALHVGAAADGLMKQGFNVRTFASEECCLLKVDNVPSTVVNLTIFNSGAVEMEYHCFDGQPHDHGLMTAIMLAVLCDGDRSAGTGQDPDVTFLSGIGRAAVAEGLSVTFVTRDCEEVAVINPARPERGTVRVSDFGDLWWSCQLGGAGGLGLEEITRSVARAITCAQAARRDKSLPRALADPGSSARLGVLQILDDAIAYRAGRLAVPCGSCGADGSCDRHARDGELIESYRRMHASVFAELLGDADPDDVSVIMQPGGAGPLTGSGVALALLAGLREAAAGSPGAKEPKAP